MREPRDRDPLLLLLAALAARVLAATASPLINADANAYLVTADRLGSGGLAIFGLHPLYPALAAAGRFLTGDAWFGAAAVSVVAGSLALLPLHALAREGWGPAAARWTGFLYAVHPAFAAFHGRVLTEGVYHLLAFSAVLWLRRAAHEGAWRPAVAGGTAVGLAYLARVEAAILAASVYGVLGLLSLRVGGRRGAAAIAVGAAATLLVVAPYLLHLRADRGRWTLSPRGVAQIESVPDPGAARLAPTAAFARDLRRVVIPAAAVLAVVGLVAFRRGASGGWTGAALAGIAAVYLGAVLANSIRLGGYISERYLSTAAALLLPWSGWGLAGLMGRLAARPVWAGAAAVALALLLGGRFLPVKDREDLPLVQAAEWLRENGGRGRRVLCSRDALAWHAGADFVGHMSPRAARAQLDAGRVDFVLYEEKELEGLQEILEGRPRVRLARFGPDGRGAVVYGLR